MSKHATVIEAARRAYVAAIGTEHEDLMLRALKQAIARAKEEQRVN